MECKTQNGFVRNVGQDHRPNTDSNEGSAVAPTGGATGELSIPTRWMRPDGCISVISHADGSRRVPAGPPPRFRRLLLGRLFDRRAFRALRLAARTSAILIGSRIGGGVGCGAQVLSIHQWPWKSAGVSVRLSRRRCNRVWMHGKSVVRLYVPEKLEEVVGCFSSWSRHCCRA